MASPINPELIAQYVDVLKKLKKQGHTLVVVVGGGELARELIGVAKKIGLKESEQDEIAISASRIFAQFFLKKLGKMVCSEIPASLKDVRNCLAERQMAVMGGLKPGMTTDSVAALVTKEIKADILVKATNQDGIFNKDPTKYPDAVKIDHLTIKELSNVFSETKHKAGIHQIIDPEAVKILRSCEAKIVVVKGFDPNNVLLAVEGKQVGTLIDIM